MSNYEANAKDFDLWEKYVDPGAVMSESEFDALTVNEKIKMQVEWFGEEDQDQDSDEIEYDAELNEDFIDGCFDKLI